MHSSGGSRAGALTPSPAPPLPPSRKATGRLVQCVESPGTRGTERSHPPFRPAGPATLLTARRSTQRRNLDSPAAARAWLRHCFLSIGRNGCQSREPVGGLAALATARPSRAQATQGEGGCCKARAGARVGGHGECCGTPVFFPTSCLSCQEPWIAVVAKPGGREGLTLRLSTNACSL